MCVNCFDNCASTLSDRCVKYTGEDIPLLGIKTGDPVSFVEKAIIESLLALTDGTKIKPADITIGCSFLTTILNGKDKTLANLIQMLIDANCSLRSLVQDLQTTLGTAASFNVSCLTGLSANPTRDQVLQAAVNKLCALSTDVSVIKNDYVKASQLNGLVQQYLTTQTTSTTTVQQSAKMVPHVAYEYYGSLSNFDSTGKGLASAGFDKVYLCNGLNGTPDRRGRVAVGALANVPGGTLDPEVDPSRSENAGKNWTLRQKFGKWITKLTIGQLPPHTHEVVDPGHEHGVPGNWTGSAGNGDGKSTVRPNFDDNTKKTTKEVTNITLKSAGNGEPVELSQPSIAALYIIHLP